MPRKRPPWWDLWNSMDGVIHYRVFFAVDV